MKIIDIALKDLLRSLRSMFLIGMTLLAPLLVTGLIFVAFGGLGSEEGGNDLPSVSVGIVNLDQAPTGSPVAIGDSLYGMFTDPSVASWLTAVEFADQAAARAALDRQEIGVAVIVPEDFSASILSGKASQPIRILQDPTLTIGPMVVQNMVTSFLDGITGGGVAVQVVMERTSASGLALDVSGINGLIPRYQAWYIAFQRTLFHDPVQAALLVSAPAAEGASQSSGTQIFSLVMAGQMIFFAFYTGAYAMMSILTEQEEGTLPRLFTTPTDRSVILAGKFLAVLITVFFQGIVLLIAGRLAFSANWGQPVSMLLALLGQVIGSTGLGVLLISLVKTSKQAGPILGGGLSAVGMLSGLFTVAVPNMPAFMNTLSLFTPQGWVLRAWKLAINGSSASELLLPLAVTLGMGLLMFVIGALLFRRRFA
jgi:ABC-2 type transport system permease protein